MSTTKRQVLIVWGGWDGHEPERCAEYGKMHVHAGAMRFPDLPRY